MRVLLDECLPRRLKQNLSTFNIAVVVLVAPGNTLADLRPLMATVVSVLPTARRGQALVIGS